MRFLTISLAVVALLAGCAQNPEPDNAAPSDTSPVAVAPKERGESPAIGLIGLWEVSGVDGETPGMWLSLSAFQLSLWQPCGHVSGSWMASESLLVAYLDGGSHQCVPGKPPVVPWLGSISGYRAIAGGWELTDAVGEVVATLAPIEGEPSLTADGWAPGQPELHDYEREYFREAAHLPDELIPATPDDLEGKWVLETDPDLYAIFRADGTWTGSWGCSMEAGVWAADDAGSFVATSGFSTAHLCTDDSGATLTDVPALVATTRSAAVDDDTLTLFDLDGVELVRLVRG